MNATQGVAQRRFNGASDPAYAFSMLAVIAEFQLTAIAAFLAALVLKAGSLACLTYEVVITGGALQILLNAVEEGQKSQSKG